MRKAISFVALMDQTRLEKKKVTVTVMQPEVRQRKVNILGEDGKPMEVEQE